MLDSVDKALAKIEEELETEPEPLAEDITSLDVVKAAYLGDIRITNKQLRAAIAALPFEYPKLSVSANVGPNVGFAKALERALKIARGEPLIIDGTAERVTTEVDY
jgi:hypothetical protein